MKVLFFGFGNWPYINITYREIVRWKKSVLEYLLLYVYAVKLTFSASAFILIVLRRFKFFSQ